MPAVAVAHGPPRPLESQVAPPPALGDWAAQAPGVLFAMAHYSPGLDDERGAGVTQHRARFPRPSLEAGDDWLRAFV